MKRILISVCGEGLGHTTRCLAIANKFKIKNKDNKILFLAYGKSKDFIEKNGYKVKETCPEIRFEGKDGKLSVLEGIKAGVTKVNPFKAVYIEYNTIKRYKPDLIFTDCKYSTAIAALLLQKDYYLITNQNTFSPKRNDLTPMKLISYFGHKGLSPFNRKAKKIIIPDLLPPNTVCDYNLKITKNMAFSGPIIRYNIEKSYQPIKGDYILSLIGGYEYKSCILEELIKIGNKKNKKIKIVCSNYKRLFSRLKKMVKFKEIEIILFVINMEDLIKKSSFIVCPGGHSTLMEAISFGKPVITIPDLNHPEQEANSRKVAELGFGILLTHNKLDKLEESIIEMENNQGYFDKASELCELAKNESQNFFKIIKEK